MQSPSGESNEIEILETRFKQRREEKKLRKDLPVFLSSENDPEAVSICCTRARIALTPFPPTVTPGIQSAAPILSQQ